MTLEKIASIKKTQEQILENMSKYVKPNGVLVYSTCTINKEENEDMIQQFLFKHPSFQKENQNEHSSHLLALFLHKLPPFLQYYSQLIEFYEDKYPLQ